MSIKTDAEIIRDETTTGANTAARVGANLVAIADELTIQKTAVSLNTGKVSYDDAAAVATNTAKVGITTQQASDITDNNAKVSYTAAAAVAANTAKETNIAHPLVETAVPVGAVFTDTDTVYDDTEVLKDADTLSPVTGVNKLMTQDDVAGLGGGDMLASTYDPIINANTAKETNIAHPLVETAVPVGAVFTDTDTVYNDNDVLKDADTLSPVTGANKLMTQDDMAGLGGGDMLSSTYDPIINANTAKVGITTQQASDITTNNSKVSYDDAAAVAANTTKKSAVTTANYTTLAAITTPTTGDVVQVTDNGIAGTFIYDATQSATINYATIISGWVRQYDGKVIRGEWCQAGFGTRWDELKYGIVNVPLNGEEFLVTEDIDASSVMVIDSNRNVNFRSHTITLTDFDLSGEGLVQNRNTGGLGNENITIKGGNFVGTANTFTHDAVTLTNVTNGLIDGCVALDIETAAGTETGNFHFINCTRSTIKNCKASGTWRMGIRILDSTYCTIQNNYVFDCRDSGIGEINTLTTDIGRNHILYNYVDNCGLSPASAASNIAANNREGTIIGNYSINANGVVGNQHGLSLGHPLGLLAWNSLVEGNFFINCDANGVNVQGAGGYGNKIVNNSFVDCGVNAYANAGAIRVEESTDTIIRGNTTKDCYRGVSIQNGTLRTQIEGNTFDNSTLQAIRNDGDGTYIGINTYLVNSTILNDVNATATETIQTKRPLKTVNGNSLEGSGDVTISSSADVVAEDLAVTGTKTIDWGAGDTFRFTMTGATVFSDSNLPAAGFSGIKTVYLDGDFAATFASGWDTNKTGTYDGTVLNTITVEYVAAVTPFHKVTIVQ